MEIEGKTVLFEKGSGNTMACADWECAWEKEWLNTYNTNPGRAEAVLKELEKAPEMPYMKESVAEFCT
ncbi:MAG: hypothetical protein IKZ87_08805 [Actinomycetaceae bacterium]|nr:hypothetical protein [Actinomycetaceae bacterium]